MLTACRPPERPPVGPLLAPGSAPADGPPARLDLPGPYPLRCADEADWNIVKKGWYAHVLGEAPNTFKDALTAVKTLRASDPPSPCGLA